MPVARKTVVDVGQVGVYHCISRCVRRAFLCGVDTYTGANYDHGEGLYEELKHVRNQLCDIENLLRQSSQSTDDVAAPIAAAHAVLARQNHRKKQPDAKQLKLL